MAAKRMHEDEVDIDDEVVRQLLVTQFPQWADLPLDEVDSTGTVNAIYRLGSDLCVRLPRVQAWADDLNKEQQWLPRLAPQLSLSVLSRSPLANPPSATRSGGRSTAGSMASHSPLTG